MNSPNYVVIGLLGAAIGKSLPSIIREIRDAMVRRTDAAANASPARGDPAHDGTHQTYWMDFASDVELLGLAIIAGLLFRFAPSSQTAFLLIFLGLAFIAKAIGDLVEDSYISFHDVEFKSGTTSAHGAESMVFLFFGISALLVIAWNSPTNAASAALGIGALGKALPSLLAANSSGGGGPPTGSSPTSYDLYEIPAKAATEGVESFPR